MRAAMTYALRVDPALFNASADLRSILGPPSPQTGTSVREDSRSARSRAKEAQKGICTMNELYFVKQRAKRPAGRDSGSGRATPAT